MKQIYYVIRTFAGAWFQRYQNPLFGLGLTMSILLFARVAFEQSFDKCFKDYDNLYQIFSVFLRPMAQTFEPQEMNCGPVAGAIQRTFLKKWKQPPAIVSG